MKKNKVIHKKMLVATSALLLGVIATGSATYAWLTLSSAPEVTNIKASIANNETLLIALLDKETYEDPTLISDYDGKQQGKVEINKTWGSMVDLSDAFYGTESITFRPAALNALEDDKLDLTAMLLTPVYGEDGRINMFNTNTLTGTFYTKESTTIRDPNGNEIDTQVVETTGFKNNGEYGVRAVGVPTGISDQAYAFKRARAAIGDELNVAKVQFGDSLRAYGSDIANIIVGHSMLDKASFDIRFIAADGENSMLSYLEKAVGGLDRSLKQYAIAHYIQANALNVDFMVPETVDIVFSKDLCMATYGFGVTSGKSTEVLMINDENFIKAYNKVETIRKAIEECRDSYDRIADPKEAGWSDVTDVLNYIIDTEYVTVNGYGMNEVKDHQNDIINSVMGGSPVTVRMPTGSGAYADAAELTGNYSANIKLENLSLNGISVTMNAKMSTGVNEVDRIILEKNLPESIKGVVSSSNAELTDVYGMILDFAFMTNKEDTYLLLSDEAVYRIANQGDNESLMGDGSKVTYTITDTVTQEMLENIMQAYRIVFVQQDGTIIGQAKLDMENKVVDAETNEISAPMRLYTSNVNTTTRVEYSSIDFYLAYENSWELYLDECSSYWDLIDARQAILNTADASGAFEGKLGEEVDNSYAENNGVYYDALKLDYDHSDAEQVARYWDYETKLAAYVSALQEYEQYSAERVAYSIMLDRFRDYKNVNFDTIEKEEYQKMVDEYDVLQKKYAELKKVYDKVSSAYNDMLTAYSEILKDQIESYQQKVREDLAYNNNEDAIDAYKNFYAENGEFDSYVEEYLTAYPDARVDYEAKKEAYDAEMSAYLADVEAYKGNYQEYLDYLSAYEKYQNYLAVKAKVNAEDSVAGDSDRYELYANDYENYLEGDSYYSDYLDYLNEITDYIQALKDESEAGENADRVENRDISAPTWSGNNPLPTLSDAVFSNSAYGTAKSSYESLFEKYGVSMEEYYEAYLAYQGALREYNELNFNLKQRAVKPVAPVVLNAPTAPINAQVHTFEWTQDKEDELKQSAVDKKPSYMNSASELPRPVKPEKPVLPTHPVPDQSYLKAAQKEYEQYQKAYEKYLNDKESGKDVTPPEEVEAPTLVSAPKLASALPDYCVMKSAITLTDPIAMVMPSKFLTAPEDKIITATTVDTESKKTYRSEWKEGTTTAENKELGEYAHEKPFINSQSFAYTTTETEMVSTWQSGEEDYAATQLIPLTVNEANVLSVLIYLDGDVVENSSITAEEKIVGDINLQFASSADLKPLSSEGSFVEED